MANLQLPEDFYFSQSALAAFIACPLKFRRRYLDGLVWPEAGEQVGGRERGRLFHLLAQRYFHGIEPLSPLPGLDPCLADWTAALRQRYSLCAGYRYYPEVELRICQGPMRLVAVFDLLAIDPAGQATIYDWKTESNLPRRSVLLQSWQTVLYRWLLVAAGDVFLPAGLAAEAATLVYWNPAGPDREERFPYSTEQQQQDGNRLLELIGVIMGCDYDQFPAVVAGHCQWCEFRFLCHGLQTAADKEIEQFEGLDSEVFDWEQVVEVEF